MRASCAEKWKARSPLGWGQGTRSTRKLRCASAASTLLPAASSGFERPSAPDSVQAADNRVQPVVYKAAVAPAPWVFEIGARYVYSSAKNWYDLYNDPTPTQLNSRLTYDGLNAHSGEGFFRIDSPSAIFVKGYFGGGSIRQGRLYDEDFPPAMSPYSKTISDTSGTLQYGNVDVGYSFYDSRGLVTSTPVRFGEFIGYHYWHEKVDAYGCTQIANSGACGVGADVLPTRAVGPGVLVMTENDTWHSFRAGGIVDIWFTPALKFTAEAAYARVWQKALDTHYLTFGSDPTTATGNGVQLEGILSYQLTPLFNVGIGARWWHFNTSGNEAIINNQLIKYQTERYGVFVQGSVKFGDNPPL